MPSDDEQELQWTTVGNGEYIPMDIGMDTERSGTVPKQFGITGVDAKEARQNFAAQKIHQKLYSHHVRHVILNNGITNKLVNHDHIYTKQLVRQMQNQLDNSASTSNHKCGVNMSSINVSPEKKRAKIMASTIGNNNSTANTICALSALNNNRYSLLDIDVPLTQTHTDTHSNSSAKNNNNIDDVNATEGTSSTEFEETQQLEMKDDTHSHRFLPPIVLYDVNIRAFIIQLKTKIPNLIFKIKNCSIRKSKLFVKDYHAYIRIMSLLKEKGINSHSYTPLQNKNISLVLRGIHCSTSPEEIKKELDELLPNYIESVTTLITPRMKQNNIKSSLFRVILKTGKYSKDLLNIKYILSQSISWEKPKSFANQMQRKRCQRWGHIAKNCNHPYHCVKCDQNHSPGECKLQKTNDSNPYCINCKQWGHPANHRGCEAYKAFVDHRISKSNIASTRVVKATSSRPHSVESSTTQIKSAVMPSISYASHFKSRNASESAAFKNASLIEHFLLIAKQLLEDDTPPLEVQIECFLKKFKSMSPDTTKAECRKILSQLK